MSLNHMGGIALFCLIAVCFATWVGVKYSKNISSFIEALKEHHVFWVIRKLIVYSVRFYYRCIGLVRGMRLREIFIACVLGILYLFLSHSVSVYILDIVEYLNKHVSNLSEESITNAIQLSYLASALDTLVFFSTIGIGFFLYQLIRPEDSRFDRKVNYLFPRAATSIGGKKYLKKMINNLAIIAPKTRVTYQFDGHCLESEVTEMTMTYESKLSNLHNKDHFANGEVKFTFNISKGTEDALDNFPPLSQRNMPEKVWGKVSKLRTISSEDLDHWRWHTRGKHFMLGHPTETFKLKNFKIPPGKEAQLDLVATTYTKNDGMEYDTFGVARFTEILEFWFVNNTTLYADVKYLQITRDIFAEQDKEYWKGTLEEHEDLEYKSMFKKPLAPTKNKENKQEYSSHRARKLFTDFSNDDLILWKVVFTKEEEFKKMQNIEENKSTTALDAQDEPESVDKDLDNE